MKLLSYIHNFLLPPQHDQGYLPYVWLSYLGIYFFNYLFRPPSDTEVITTLIIIPVFLVIYFSAFRRDGLSLVIHIILLYLIGIYTSQENIGGSVFIVYAASFCAQFDKAKNGFTMLIALIAATAFYSFLFNLSSYFYLPAIFFSILVGGSNIYFSEVSKKNQVIKKSQEEIEKLATTAERERIARDLHDVIGHTFSLITRKAELARKLVDKDAEKAKAEILDIELESRRALSQVREAVSGYRKTNLSNELLAAKNLCQISEIEFEEEVKSCDLNESISNSLGFIIKEAFTNISRHSSADSVRVKFDIISGNYQLEIKDNGSIKSDTPITFGNGLIGIKERVHQLNGSLNISTNEGFRLTVLIPVHS
ncbi:sensor histidine kinase [Pleionea sediminis]|uniref:sensor histidine kinase n=1 Tax=Pleionea sediminis TaxID=2569479 RepID=UPI0011854999|nr:sensor histidine kinase [Pleionea sediminis]